MKAMSTRNDDPATASRPFDKDRDGFVLGDGGAVPHAREPRARREARRRRSWARCCGYGLSRRCLPHVAAGARGRGRPARHARLPRRAARSIRRTSGYINAHGTSTPLGDIAETQAVKAVFGDHARKLIFGSTKSMTGHLLGGAGGLEFVVVAPGGTRTGEIPPTINQFTPGSRVRPRLRPEQDGGAELQGGGVERLRLRRAQCGAGGEALRIACLPCSVRDAPASRLATVTPPRRDSCDRSP